MKVRIPNSGGPGNMNQMLKQAQKMQDEITKLQDDIEEREFTATAGGGAVEVVLYGKKAIKSLTIKPDVVDKEDIEMLQDLIVAAVNEGMRKVDADSSAQLGSITGGLNIPGLF